MKYVYKAVKRNSNHFRSCRIEGEYMLFYKLNKETTPKIGRIFTFETKEEAGKFIEGGETILKCTYRGHRKPLKFHSSYYINGGDGFLMFWEDQKAVYKNYQFKLHTSPPGTVTVKSLTPIEEVTL